jgi:hypothetical protein
MAKGGPSTGLSPPQGPHLCVSALYVECWCLTQWQIALKRLQLALLLVVIHQDGRVCSRVLQVQETGSHAAQSTVLPANDVTDLAQS